MIHGAAHTSACYLRTPDGRPSWAYDFAQKGYEVFVPDWPGCGQSDPIALELHDGARIVAGLASLLEEIGGGVILVTHSMAGPYGWKLAELCNSIITRVIAVAPGPMGNIQEHSKILHESSDELTIRFLGNELTLDRAAPFSYSDAGAREKMIGDRSQHFPREYASEYLASLHPIAPQLMHERCNVRGSQLRVDDFRALSKIKFAVITGTDDLDHPPELDQQIVTYLLSHGISADFIDLGSRGIVGNGHMLMLEKNSSAIASIMLEWLHNTL